jgi:hypothetical protein
VREGRVSIVVLAIAAALIAAPAAQGAITVGSSLSAPVDNAIGGDITAFPIAPATQLTTSPVTGTVVGGNVKQGSGSGWGSASLRVVHPAAGGLYQVVASGPANTIPAGAGIFPLVAHIPIAKGDLVAVQGTVVVYDAVTTGATYLWHITSTFPTGGPPVTMNDGFTDTELLYNAQIDPSNAFTVGAPTGGKKGKATVVVTVPNPGTVGAGSFNDGSLAVTAKKKKKKKAKPLLSRVTATAADAGQVTLTLTASKAGRKVLREKGKLKTTAKVVFTPTGGTAASQSIPLKLKP